MRPEETGDGAARPALLVLGMHRSGTSALAGVLAHMGCATPLTPIGAAAQNPRGFFESFPVARLDDRILEAAGSSWHDWRPLALDAPDSPEGVLFRDAGARLLREEFAGADPFVLKDPRICRLVPLWLDVLEREGHRPVLLLAHRDPYEVARSLQARNAFPLSYGLLLWLRHVLDAERDTRGRPRLVVGYDQVLADWRAVVGRIADRFALAFPRALEEAEAEVSAFLSAELRHHAAPRDEAVDPALAEVVRDAAAILERWSREGEDERDHAALDRIEARLAGASWTFGDIPRAAALKAEQALAELGAAKARAARLEARVVEDAQWRSVADRLLAETQGALAEATIRNRDLAEEGERQARELGTLARLLREAEDRLDEARARIEAEAERLRETEARLRATEAQLEAACRAHEEAEQRYRGVVESSSWRLTAPMRRVADRLRGP